MSHRPYPDFEPLAKSLQQTVCYAAEDANARLSQFIERLTAAGWPTPVGPACHTGGSC